MPSPGDVAGGVAEVDPERAEAPLDAVGLGPAVAVGALQADPDPARPEGVGGGKEEVAVDAVPDPLVECGDLDRLPDAEHASGVELELSGEAVDRLGGEGRNEEQGEKEKPPQSRTSGRSRSWAVATSK